jgi:Zn-dependent protease with chaperone function
VFVKEGLLRSLSPSDDELAVVLAHEVAHVVLGHTGSNLDSSNHMQALLLSAQLVLLSAIDLTGVLSFLLESALDGGFRRVFPEARE